MLKNKSRLSNKLILVIFLVLLLMVLAILELTDTTHLLHKQKVPVIIPATSSSSSSMKTSSGTQPSPSSSPTVTNNKTPSSTAVSGQTLITPFGNFVSNHNPGAKDSSGNITPTAETSVCDTTPGATCYIKFTRVDNGQITQLPTQVVGSDGSTSWSWDIKRDAHLTQGQWQITAVASLSGQTKSADDTLKLTVQ